MKIAFVFPGQGTQYRTMGRAFYESYAVSKEIFDMADKISQNRVSELCFNAGEEELIKTTNQQPAIHTTEIAILKAVESMGVRADMTAGFSLGEYAALVCAGCLKFEDSLNLVGKRGHIIQNCIAQGLGKMAALIGLNKDEVEKILVEAREFGTIECSNFNTPTQIIVSGYNKAVDRAVELAYQFGAKKCVFLKVSAPFHTSIIKSAGAAMKLELQKVDIKRPDMIFIPNVTAKPLEEEEDIADLLDRHVWYPVRWEETVVKMANLGADFILEIGPSGSLTKYNREILEHIGANHIRVMSIEHPAQLDEFLDLYKNR